jgi:hypothetical protein
MDHPTFAGIGSELLPSFAAANNNSDDFMRCWKQWSCDKCLEVVGCGWCPYVRPIYHLIYPKTTLLPRSPPKLPFSAIPNSFVSLDLGLRPQQCLNGNPHPHRCQRLSPPRRALGTPHPTSWLQRVDPQLSFRRGRRANHRPTSAVDLGARSFDYVLRSAGQAECGVVAEHGAWCARKSSEAVALGGRG